MPHLALARKWRPQRFEDVIGQRGVVDTLKNAIGSGRLAQAFVFAGPRGVGKTTTARILSRALNCVNGPTPTPCGECDACVEIAEGRDVDVMEIDAATYTGVDDVREVIVEPLGIAPMRDRYKIFIIDEVHRLSANAFDALLKSIEEPPPYVKFMMATTELGKVPATIQSRSQVFELKALGFASIRDQLRAVTSKENVEIDDAALALVARAAEGSMRDALSALDQVLAFTSSSVTAADVSAVLGLIGRDLQFDVVETIAREDLPGAFAIAGTVVDAGFDLRIVCRELARLARDLLIVRIDPSRLADPEVAAESDRERLKALADRFSREDLMRAFDLLSKSEYDIKGSSQPRHHFEMMLVKWIHLRQLTPLSELIEGLSRGSISAGASAPRPAAAMPPRPTGAMPPRPSGPTAPSQTTSSANAGGGRPASAAVSPSPASSPSRPAPPPSSSPSGQSSPSRTSAAPSSSPAGASSSAGASRSVSAPAGSSTSAAASANKSDAASLAPAAGGDLKGAILATIREQNKLFFGTAVAQAQKVEVQGDEVIFTFAPLHAMLKRQLESKRAWIEQLAMSASGRRMTLVVRESAPVAAPDTSGEEAVAARQADLRARAKAEPAVQTMLDVFGGEIQDVEEIK